MAGMSRRLTAEVTTRSAGTPLESDDHQRHLDELSIQATAVEEQDVIAEVLAVIRGDDHQGIVEHTAPLRAPGAGSPAADQDKRMQSSYISAAMRTS